MATVLERSARSKRPATPAIRLPAILRWVLLVGLATMVLYPLSTVVYSSFLDTPPGLPGNLTFDAWRAVLSDGFALNALWTTFRIVIPKLILGLAFATTFAWLLARTNIPFKPLLEGLMYFTWFMPALPVVLAWILLLSPRAGYLNQWLEPILPFGFRFNAFSYEALVILGGVGLVPFLFLFIYPVFRNMDATLEESARMAGASPTRAFFRITLPLMLPGILAAGTLATILSIESFEVEQLLGVPAGIYVFTTRLYDFLYGQGIPKYGHATAIGLVLMVITLSLIFVQRRLLGSRSYTTVTGRAFQARPYDLGGMRWIAFAFMFTFFVVFAMVPFVILVVNSFMRVSGFIGLELFTTGNWQRTFTDRALVTSIRNTLFVGIITATIGVVVTALIAYTATRVRWAGRSWMDYLAWLPIGVPGLVLGLACLWAFVRLPIYGTLWILMLAFLIRGLPTGSRFFTATMVQVSAELEEASRIHGGTWLRTFLRIWAPLLMPAVLTSWIFMFVLSVRLLDAPLLLTGAGTEVLSVIIFQQVSRGNEAVASALSLVQMGIITLAYIITRVTQARTRFRIT